MKLLLLGTIGENARQLSKLLLQYSLASRFGIQKMPEISRTSNGKPFFKHLPLSFNLSHSGPFALCAIGPSPVGVDIECVKPRRAGIERRILTEGERERLKNATTYTEELIALWTLKESYLKYTGTGLRVSPQTVEFWLEADGAVRSSQKGLTFRWFAGRGYRAALCVKGERLPQTIQWVPSEALLEREKENAT